MLSLRPRLAYNLQMDWSPNLSEEIKDEIKSEPEDIKSELKDISDFPDTTRSHDAVTQHFEESFRRLAVFQKATASNKYPQNRINAFVPYIRFNHLDIKPPKPPLPFKQHGSGCNRTPLHSSNHQRSAGSNSQGPSSSVSSFNTTSQLKEHVTTPTPASYDVESISQMLKTFPFNRFINSSILQQEESLDTTNGDGGFSYQKVSQNSSNMVGVGIWQANIERDTSPLLTVNTDVDIEAELPSTSIKQRPPPKRKLSKPRKNEVAPSSQELPIKVMKKSSNRSTKRKTNYREASSDDEPTAGMNRKSRCNTQSIKKKSAILPVPVNEMKEEIVDIKPELNVEIKEEVDLQVKKETDLEIKKEVDLEINEKVDLEVKKEVDFEIKGEVDQEVKVKVDLEAKMDVDLEIKSEIELEVKTETLIENIKNEVKNEPVVVKNKSETKPKRVRNPAAAAAAARNRNKLHPLTRKEQLMMNKLIKSKEPFLQNLPCLKLASRVSKCRECRCSSFRSDSAFCRFYDFRRLRFKENAILVVDGFSDPNKDPGPNDISIWMPGPPPRDIDLEVCRFILMHVGDQFCRIWQEEQTAINEHMSVNPTIAWKKVVKGVREICDVCETTLFNFHWTCSKCGFGVCLDCYKDRKSKRTKKNETPTRGFDDYGWLVCTFRENHIQSNLMLTQIIPGNSLNFLANRLHEVCKLWKIPQKCGCPLSAGIKEELFMPKFVEISNNMVKDAYLRFHSRESQIRFQDKIKGLNPDDSHHSALITEAEMELIEQTRVAGTLPVIMATTLKHLTGRVYPNDSTKPPNTDHLQDTVTKEYNDLKTRTRPQRDLTQRIMTPHISRSKFAGIEHDWLCHGRLLRLLESRNSRNALIFQEVWKRGQPVMVSELCTFLNISLWHPQAFCRDFGEIKNDLINCMTGNLVPNQPMKHFWEGFLSVGKRLLDEQGQPMLLKLKDWPPGDDFAEILPTRFADLMSALPLPEYTLRTGSLNIASRLPNIFVPPDLGPKMYNAYGSALHPDKGTTNLHLDISDAVNIMVYVGIPTDASAKEQIRAALRAIDSGGCDFITRQRARQEGVLPGALWHIYSARDADKIRDLLNRVTIERGYRLEPDHDPIHDQNWYLDNELRARLFDDFGVEGFPILQCLGDAIFIPAGAPHQVRNLHNCIKVAEDFVSPENIEHCFHLSQEFRKLSMSHTNHEDKLQIRNVIYHAVKDTTSYLTFLLNRHL